MEELLKSNTIYAGIGSDLREVLESMRSKQGKTAIRNTSVLNTWFVDPAISKDIKLDHVERTTLESFIRRKIIMDYLFFKDATISADRMIEHMDLQTLSLVLLPMLCNLVLYCKSNVTLTFPNIERISEELNDPDSSLFGHELCNIEAIAFGDHKSIFTEKRFTRMLSRYCDAYPSLNITYEDANMDYKKFYTKVNIKPGSVMKETNINYIDNSSISLSIVDPGKSLQEFAYEFNEKLEKELMIEETTGCPLKASSLNKHLNFYFKYIDLDKMSKLCRYGLTRYQYKYVYDSNIVCEVMTREGHFETLPHPSIDLLNKIDPLYGWYSFKKLI